MTHSSMYKYEVDTLDVDGWTVTFGTARRGLGGARPGPLRCTNVTTHPSTSSVPITVLLDNALRLYCAC